MCGRFTVEKTQDIQKRFSNSSKLPFFEPSWNVAPSQMVLTVTRNSPNKVILMKWGFVWRKDEKFGTINLRSESFREKPFFKQYLLKKRCLIIADSFYEWGIVDLEGKPEKYPFNFYLNDRELFGFAGIYNNFSDAEGKPIYTCTILTCPPNNLVKKVHNRMPVIINKDDEDFWLNPENDDFESLFNLLKPYSENKMNMHIVEKRVNNPANDDENLVEEI